MAGNSPYGFKWVNKELVVNEKEAPILKLMFELFLKHKRKRRVAEELNRMGYRTGRNSRFTGIGVHRMLLDPAAKGIRRSNYTTVVNNKVVLKPESEWVMVPCPQIISPDVWDSVREILEAQVEKYHKPGPPAVYLLSGFVKCSCGRKMYVFHRNKADYTCQPCRTRIPSEDLHDIYYDQLKAFLLTETDVKEYAAQTDSRIQEKQKQLSVLENEAATLRKRKTELINLRIAGEFSKETFAEQFKPVEERLAQIDMQLPEFQAEIDFLTIQHLSSDTVLQEAKDLYTRWPTLSFEQKRTIVEVITDSITVGKEDISIKLAYMPTLSSQNMVKSNQSPWALPQGEGLTNQ